MSENAGKRIRKDKENEKGIGIGNCGGDVVSGVTITNENKDTASKVEITSDRAGGYVVLYIFCSTVFCR